MCKTPSHKHPQTALKAFEEVMRTIRPFAKRPRVSELPPDKWNVDDASRKGKDG